LNVQVPKELIAEKSTMCDAFLRCAEGRGDHQNLAIDLLRLLPTPLQNALVWLDSLTNLWRYRYGIPYNRMSQGMIISGTNVHLPVCELYIAMKVANSRLKPAQLETFLQRLTDKGKHSDVLFEMRPIIDVKPSLQMNYEVSGFGIGNTTCDWQVKGAAVNIVFDVKNRTKPFLEHMNQIIPGLNGGADNCKPSAPNPEDLFKSVENKLKEKCYLTQMQGAWIHSDIKEHEDKLTLYFKKTLSSRKVHFAILSDWKNDAFILSRNLVIKKILKKTFGLTESKRFVTKDYA